jgi:hypothetical protein
VPATLNWINPAGGDWNDARNWDAGRVPTRGDDAVIRYANVVVTFSAGYVDPIGPISVHPTEQVNSLQCAGTLNVVSGKLEVLDTSSINDLDLSSGTLASWKTLQVIGDFHWSGGTLAGLSGNAGTIQLYGTTTTSGSASKTLDQVLVSNYGVFNWEQGQIRALHNAGFTNAAGGVFNAHASSQFRPAAENDGRWVIDVKGTAEFGNFNNLGDLTLDNGKMKAGLFVQTAGLTRLDGGSLSSSYFLTFTGGQLQGGGTISGSLVNAGARVVPSPTGSVGHTLTVEGDYTQGDHGVLALLLSGSASAGNFDQLIVKGTATLGGKLEVRGRSLPAAANGDSYAALTAGTVKGNFASVTTPRVAGGTMAVNYSNKQVTLTLTPVVGNPDPNPGPAKDPAVINSGGIIQVIAQASGLATHASLVNGLHPTSTAVPADSADEAAPFNVASSVFSADLTRALLLNSGLLGQILNGASRSELTSPSDTFAGRLTAASVAVSTIDKSASGRTTDGAGDDELALAALSLNLPELTLPSENDLLSADDLNRDLLLGGGARADIVPQAGSQLSVVATLVAGDEGRASGEEKSESPLTDLFISPLAMGDTSLVALRPAARPAAKLAKADAPEPSAGETEGDGRTPQARAFGALVVLTAFAGVIVGLTQSERDAQRKLCSGPGKRPSRTSRQ